MLRFMETLMRTTLNIDEGLLAAYKELAAHSHASLSHVIQDALREALTLRRARDQRPPIRLSAFAESGGLVAGVDLMDHAALSEVLEQPSDDALRRRMRGSADDSGAEDADAAGPADDSEPA
jgi:hypothetical protein